MRKIAILFSLAFVLVSFYFETDISPFRAFYKTTARFMLYPSHQPGTIGRV